MINLKIKFIAVTLLMLFALVAMSKQAQASDNHYGASHIKELKLENLMSAQLAGVEKTEVIVSRVAIPANTSLPTHWHPGEEFAYVLQGEVTLWQKGKQDITAKAGDVVKVPLKQIHTAKTGEKAALILVFRVHESGQPERIKAE